MKSGVIIVKNAGQLVPQAVLEKFLQQFPLYGSVAAFGEGGIIEDANEGRPFTPEGLQELQEAFKDEKFFIFLGNSDTDVPGNALQPYPILFNKDKQPILSAFVEGEFPGYTSGPGVVAHDTFLMTQNFLIPTIKDHYSSVGEDLDKLFTKLDEPFIARSILAQAAGRGVIVLIGANEKVQTFSKNDLRLQAPWGWASQNCGMKAEEVVEKKQEPASLKDRLLGKKTKASVPEVSPPIEDPKTDTAPADLPEQPKAPEEMVMAAPSLGFTNKQKQKWYRMKLGTVPEGYKRGPFVSIARSKLDPTDQVKDPASLKDLKDLGAVKEKVVVGSAAPKKSDTAPKHIASTKPVTPPVLPHMAPALRAEQKKFSQSKLVQETVATHGASMLDPVKLKELVKDMPDYAEQSGIPTAEIEKWPYAVFVAMAKDPNVCEGLALLAFNYRNKYINLKNGVRSEIRNRAEGEEHQEDDNVVEQETAPATETPVETTAPAPAAGGVKGAMSRLLGNKKKAA